MLRPSPESDEGPRTEVREPPPTRTRQSTDTPEGTGSGTPTGGNQLGELLRVVGLELDEVVSFGTQKPGTPFTGGTRTVEALTAQERWPQDRHLWAGLVPMNAAAEGRGTASDALRVPALWADLDYKPDGLGGEEACRAVVEDLADMLGTPPAAIILSGGGLQPVWRLSADLNVARTLLPRWRGLVTHVAERHGGKADSVYDLARILRIPGTLNHKYDPPRPTSVEFPEGAVVTAEALTEVLDTYAIPEAQPRVLDGTEGVLAEEWDGSEVTCDYVRTVLARWPDDRPQGGSRHYWLYARTIRLEAARRLGCISAEDHNKALNLLQRISDELRAHDGRRGNEIWGDCLPSATKEVEGKTDGEVAEEWQDHEHQGAGDTAEEVASVEEAFWGSRPILTHIREHSLVRLAAPLGTLAVVLARVVAVIPPTVTLPPIVGGKGSLNIFFALVGLSGGGKGACMAAANDALRYGGWADETRPGSGEGLSHMFTRRTKGKVEQYRSNVLLTLQEADSLSALSNRQGSTLEPELRGLWLAEPLGFGYVDPARNVPTGAHTYRCSLLLGVQPRRARSLLAGSDGGTPQRLIWAPVQDPRAPSLDEIPLEAPETWNWRPPAMLMQRPHTMGVPASVRDEIRRARYDMLTRRLDDDGDTNGHRGMAQLKAAAALAILDGRGDVNEEDWYLAGILLQMSDHIRERVQAILDRTSRAARRMEALEVGEIDDEVTEHRAERRTERNIAQASTAVLRAVDKHTADGGHEGRGCRRRCLKDACNNTFRDALPEALRRLVEAGRIDEHPAKQGGATFTRGEVK